jgi:hypothetical protein
MTRHLRDRSHPALRAVLGGAAIVGLPYLGAVASTWYRYGRPDGRPDEGSLLDQFMPDYEVRECHEIDVAAPAATTLAAARDMDIYRSPLVRALFAVRTLPSRLRGREPEAHTSLLEETQALGWRILAEAPDRELVVGAVTQPWRPEVRFRGLDPDAFIRFAEPGYARIAWTLEAVPLTEQSSRFRTETRASTTDPASRRRFRRYWAVIAPGVRLIRRASLGLVKAEAERRHAAAAEPAAAPAPALAAR